MEETLSLATESEVSTDAAEEAKSITVTYTDKQNNTTVEVDYGHVKRAAMILRALKHDLRQQMVKLLDENQRMTVTEIYVKLRLEQSVASQHLAILRDAGVVSTQRDGKFIYYSVNYSRIAEVQKFVDNLLV